MLIDIEQQNGVYILRCKGRFVAGPEMDYMQSKLEDIQRLACTKVLADFEDVIAIGSLGVAFLVGVYSSVVRKPGGGFVLAGACPMVQHVLDLTRLSTVIPQASDLGSGLARLRADASMSLMALSNDVSA
jgi:anti-anti-sigma factor